MPPEPPMRISDLVRGWKGDQSAQSRGRGMVQDPALEGVVLALGTVRRECAKQGATALVLQL